MNILTESLLNEMVRVIVKEINPRKIILFGSYARGNINPNSDVDLLIIDDNPFGPGRSRRKKMGALWRSLARFFIPIDILLYSSDEIEQWRDSKNHVIAQAIKEGRVVYEQN
ncbi:MAG: nucleotidyltransferase domain-containing protein [Deltaproteobacteria bacterium]|nr:nucleotidyltransferase domain-containing protein [Deltaproteobacteria bacterium]